MERVQLSQEKVWIDHWTAERLVDIARLELVCRADKEHSVVPQMCSRILGSGVGKGPLEEHTVWWGWLT